MLASVLIVNYNGSKFLKNLFRSLSRQTLKDFEVIFVDNNSTDNSLDILTKILADDVANILNVKVVRLNRNIGFCEGNNIGLRHSNGNYIVFLNNDTYVSSTWLAELVEVMSNDSSIGACQSRHIQARTCKVQTDGWQLDKYGWSQRMIFYGDGKKVGKFSFYVSGASVIISKANLDKICGFDQELFYGDFDICWRLRLMGYEMAVALHSYCYHYGGAASNQLYSSIERIYRHSREILRVLLKNYSSVNVLRRVPLSIAIMVAEATYLAFKHRNPLYFLSFLRALAWNLCRIRTTIIFRRKVQDYRTTFDHQIELSMVNHSVLLARRL